MSIKGAFAVPHPPIIFPEIGNGEEHKIDKTIHAYRKISEKVKKLKPDTIIVISPHSVMYADYFHISPGEQARGDMGDFNASRVSLEVEYDSEFVDKLVSYTDADGFPAGTLGEKSPTLDHGTIIPLRFINEHYEDYKVVRIGISGLSLEDHYVLGEYITKTAEVLDRDCVVIGSGDLSHRLLDSGPYTYAEQGPLFDEIVTACFDQGDFYKLLDMDPAFAEKAGECGLRSFIVMAGTLDGRKVDSKLLSYEGPFGVGYSVASFIQTGKVDNERRFLDQYNKQMEGRIELIRESESDYVKLARKTLETYVKTGKKYRPSRNNSDILDSKENLDNHSLDGKGNLADSDGTNGSNDELPEEMTDRKAGVFVSLKKDGLLRGCIGTIQPTQDSVADEIIENAISAGANDPRFEPVRESELSKMIYSVDVLSDPEPINDRSLLDPKKYGVIVTQGFKRGLLLPNLDGIDTVDDQISIAMNKADIPQGEGVSLERFEVTRYE